jgi:hypothetical protein
MTIVETTPAMEVTSVIAPHTITDDDLERVFIEGEAADRFDNLVTTIAYLGQYQLDWQHLQVYRLNFCQLQSPLIHIAVRLDTLMATLTK